MKKMKKRNIALALIPILITAAGIFLTVKILSVGKNIDVLSDAEIVERYIETEKNGKILSFAEEYVSSRLSPYESRELADGKVQKTVCADNLSFARSDEYSEASPEFIIYCLGSEFLSVKVKDGKIADESVIGTDCLGKEYTVYVPHGAKLTVNGIEADAANAEKADYPLLTVFESGLSETVYSDKYTLGTIFSYPEIKAALDGKTLFGSRTEGDAVIFPYPSDMTETVEFSVPYGSEVLVNGMVPDKSFISDSSAVYPYLTRFEEKSVDVPKACEYRIKGMFSAPDIKVTYGGETLACERNNAYRLPESMTNSVTVTAPDYATVKINGVALGKAEISVDGTDIPILAEVTNYAKNRPYLTEYHVSGLIGEPVIAAYGEDGKPLPADIHSSTGESVVFCTPVSEIPEEDLITVNTFAKNYIRYRYSGSSGISSNYSSLIAMTPGKSAGYKKLKSEYGKIQKLPVYTNITYGKPVYNTFRVYGDSYSCDMTYPFTAKIDGEVKSFELNIEILYVFSGKIRRVVNYIVY